MKIQLKLLIIVSALFVVLPSAVYSMKVSFFLGKVTLDRGGSSATLNLGDEVSNGDIIKTGRGALVELSYKNNSKVTVQGNTVVKIGSSGVKGSNDIAVVSGQIKGKFVKLHKGKYKLYTPTTVCSVRGTEFKIAVSRGGDSRVNLKNGKLDINNPYGSTKLKAGYSVDSDVAGEPVKKRTRGSIDKWEKSRNKSLEKDIVKQAEKYDRHMNKFEEESGKNGSGLDELDSEMANLKTKEDLEKSGEKIANAEESIADNMMMNEASERNVRNLMKDFEGNDIYEKFEKISNKSEAVREEQLKNFKAIQKIKAEYNEARDKIMKKFGDDKKKIFNDLDKFKKNMFKKDDEE